ncbi:Rv2732c family membrane protein [Saccharopolyspora phatthalungensis]|uniref:Uncharacterized protein n=1 Tax=Saccharopolyspora phatthalungensis TaxID=664693 RepID=A0A840Q6K2_9PSEU|nr:hypothetical protein [Saccharopolyspora phatthalungensis]
MSNADESGESRRQLAETEREILRRIDPGLRALVIASVMLVLIVCSLLPWVGRAVGWEVLMGQADPALNIGLLPRLFAINSTIVGLGFGALALITRRWVIAFLAGVAGVVVTFEGMIAIWSRQTSGAAGPSIGLVLAVVCMAVLAVQWMRIVWSRS